MLREAKRNNAQYKPHALRCLGQYARVRKEDLDLVVDAVDIGRDVYDDINGRDMDIDSREALK